MKIVMVLRKEKLLPVLLMLLFSILSNGWAADLVKYTSSLNRGSATFRDDGKLALTTKRCFQNVPSERFPPSFIAPLALSFSDYTMAHVDGLIFLRGTLYQNQTSFPGSYKYTTNAGTVMASLSDNGNLYLKSTLVTSSSCTQPPYESGLWNDGDNIQHNDNCYNYANNQITYTYSQPGRASGYPEWSHDSQMNVTYVRQRSLGDGLTWVGWSFPGTGYVCPGGGHLVFMAVDPEDDYHWYRRDINTGSKWSHKPGGGEATNRDASGNEISNPLTADRNYGWVNYTDNGGFYCTCGNNANAR